MSVAISGSNPAYSLQSVLQTQLEGLTQPPPTASTSASAAPPAKPTYNNLPSSEQPSNDLPSDTGDASSSTSDLDPIGAAKSSAANLATSTTANALTYGGSVSVQPYKGSAAQVVFTNGATGEKSVIGTATAGLTSNVNGSNVSVGNFSNNDVGVYAAFANAPTPLPGTANASISVQSGATQGPSNEPVGAPSVQTESSVSQAALQNANDDAGHLSAFISQYA